MVTHQLQVERRTAKGHRPKTDALPLDYATSERVKSVIHEDEDAAVEAVRPACVRCRRQLVALEQVVDVAEHQRVGVEEHALVVLCQSPAVQLRERDAQLRPTQSVRVR